MSPPYVACSTTLVHKAQSVSAIQDQHLPAGANCSLRQQLHSWARHVAAVKRGGLYAVKELNNCPDGMVLSPKLDCVAAQCVHSKQYSVAPLPSAGLKIDV